MNSEEMNAHQLTVIRSIIESVFNPPADWCLGKNRKRESALPRQVAHWVSYYYTKNKHKDISFCFGRLNPDNINNSVNVINGLVSIDEDISLKVRDVCLRLSEHNMKVLHKYGRNMPVKSTRSSYGIQTKFAPKKQRGDFVGDPRAKVRRLKMLLKIAEKAVVQHVF